MIRLLVKESISDYCKTIVKKSFKNVVATINFHNFNINSFDTFGYLFRCCLDPRIFLTSYLINYLQASND